MKTLWSILLLSSAFVQASQGEDLRKQIQQDIEAGRQAIEQQFQQMLNPQPSALSPENRANLERELQEQKQKLMKTAGVVIVGGAGIYGLYSWFFKK